MQLSDGPPTFRRKNLFLFWNDWLSLRCHVLTTCTRKKYCDKFWSKNVVSISFILINITFCNSSLLFPTLGFLYSWRKHSCNKCSLLFQRSVPRDCWHVLDASLYVCVCGQGDLSHWFSEKCWFLLQIWK